jgi:hypothetical protein
MNLFLALTILLLILGIVGSFTPAVPGALLSGAGIFIYWWSTGYTEPGTLFITITAKIGGASNKTSFMASIAGVLGFIFLGGPLGVLIAVGGTVFIREYLKHGKMQKARKSALYSALGFFASAFMQALITSFLLIAFLATLLI